MNLSPGTEDAEVLTEPNIEIGIDAHLLCVLWEKTILTTGLGMDSRLEPQMVSQIGIVPGIESRIRLEPLLLTRLTTIVHGDGTDYWTMTETEKRTELIMEPDGAHEKMSALFP